VRSLMNLARWEAIVLFFGFIAVVLWKLMTGGISLSYLLDSDIPDADSPTAFSSDVSAGRTQLLVVTLAVAAYYLLQVIQNPREFPQVPTTMIAALGGSHALYLAGKARTLLAGRLKDLFK